MKQSARAFTAGVDGVEARRRRLAEQHLRVREAGRDETFVAGLVEAAVDARRGRLAAGAPLRQQEGRVVGLVPDRVDRDLRAELARDGGHEFLEVVLVGTRDVRRLLVGGRPARHRRGDGQQHGPAEGLRAGEHRRVERPVVRGGVGRVEGRLRGAARRGDDRGPRELHAQGFDAERLHLGEDLRLVVAFEQRRAGLEVSGLTLGGGGAGRKRQGAAARRPARRGSVRERNLGMVD